MTALREYARDAGIPERAGDARLRPPSAEQALAIASTALVLPGGPELLDATWEHARWTPHSACTALFRVATSDGRELHLVVERRANPRARPSRPARSVRLSGVLPGLRPEVELEDGTLASWFPADRSLPGARRLHDPARLRRLFAHADAFAGRTIRAHRTRLTVLRYKPGQRAVLRLDVAVREPDGRRVRIPVAARALPPRKAERVLAARAECRTSAALAPRLVAHEERSGLVVEEWLDGRTCAAGSLDVAHDAARVLARLHAEPAAGPICDEGTHGLLELFEVDRALWTHARRIASRPLPAAGSPRWIHGDFHPGQVQQRADGSIALLDWDALRAGDPAEDLASWWADALAAGADRESTLDALLEGHARGGGRTPERASLVAWAQRGLARRAAAAIRRLESGAVEKAARLLDVAEELRS